MIKFTSLGNDPVGSVLNILKLLQLYFPTTVEQGHISATQFSTRSPATLILTSHNFWTISRADYNQHRNDGRVHDFVLSQQVVRCAVYNRYKMGPRTEPCGTVISLTDDFVSSISTNWARSDRYEWDHLRTVPLMHKYRLLYQFWKKFQIGHRTEVGKLLIVRIRFLQ